MNIFVGNLSFSATEEDVRRIFTVFGTVESVNIKKKSGKNSRGFGFVSMPDELQAQAAIVALEGKDFMGRAMEVTPQRIKLEKPKKDYKAIKKQRLETKLQAPVVIVPEEEKSAPKSKEAPKKYTRSSGSRVWEKRKGTGNSKAWKKTPGGIKKKFKSSR